MIYFVQATDGGPVKIGFSDDVNRRIDQLEAKYGRELAVLSVIPGDRTDEREIHGRFAHLRFGRTEQFAPASEIFEFIGKPLLATANPHAVEVMPCTEVSKPIIATMRGSQEFKEFLEEAARKDRSSVADFLERAAVRYARELGIDREPPDR